LIESLNFECAQLRKTCEEEQARAQELEKENAMLKEQLMQVFYLNPTTLKEVLIRMN